MQVGNFGRGLMVAGLVAVSATVISQPQAYAAVPAANCSHHYFNTLGGVSAALVVCGSNAYGYVRNLNSFAVTSGSQYGFYIAQIPGSAVQRNNVTVAPHGHAFVGPIAVVCGITYGVTFNEVKPIQVSPGGNMQIC